MSWSGTMRVNLMMEVVVANDPMPSVSKKLVMKPVRSAGSVGRQWVSARNALAQMKI